MSVLDFGFADTTLFNKHLSDLNIFVIVYKVLDFILKGYIF